MHKKNPTFLSFMKCDAVLQNVLVQRIQPFLFSVSFSSNSSTVKQNGGETSTQESIIYLKSCSPFQKWNSDSVCWNTKMWRDPARFTLCKWPGMTAKHLLKHTRSRTTCTWCKQCVQTVWVGQSAERAWRAPGIWTSSSEVHESETCCCGTTWGQKKKKKKTRTGNRARGFLIMINTPQRVSTCW